jgi:hypothetical protein
VVESHDAGMYKNEDAYRMLSKMQKGAYCNTYQEESIALAEIFVEMKAEQVEKEANQAKKEATQAQKEAKQAQKEAIKMLTGRSRAATTS